MNLNTFVVSLVFILSGVDGPAGESDGTVSTTVTVKVGDDAILPCDLKPLLNLIGLAVEWKYNGTKVHFYRSRGDDLRGQDERFKGRTSLFHNEMTKGNVSLKLTNVNKTHEGNYTCKIVGNRVQLKPCNVTLIVTQGADADESIRGDARMGTDVIVGIVFGVLGVAVFLGVGAVAIRLVPWHGMLGAEQEREAVSPNDPDYNHDYNQDDSQRETELDNR